MHFTELMEIIHLLFTACLICFCIFISYIHFWYAIDKGVPMSLDYYNAQKISIFWVFLVRNFRIRTVSLSVFSPNAGKHGPENSEYGHFSHSTTIPINTNQWRITTGLFHGKDYAVIPNKQNSCGCNMKILIFLFFIYNAFVFLILVIDGDTESNPGFKTKTKKPIFFLMLPLASQ